MKYMKPPAPELHNTRILRLAQQAVTLPFVFARACCVWLFRRCRSDEQLRAADQQRQSRVRRGLRGLSPDHVKRPA
jgi:hypothetical protein